MSDFEDYSDLQRGAMKHPPVVSRSGIDLHPKDRKRIEDAQLVVELTVDPYCMHTQGWGGETYSHQPRDTDHRMLEDVYIWMLYSAHAPPHAGIGVQGDVWIDCTPQAEKVYFRGKSETWVPWNKPFDHDPGHRPLRRLEVAHPWLPDRCLQFNGFDLGWYAHSALEMHQKRWDASCGQLSPYAKLSPQYLAAFRTDMERASLSRKVIQPSPRARASQSSKGAQHKHPMPLGEPRAAKASSASQASCSNHASSSPASQVHKITSRHGGDSAGSQHPFKRARWPLSDSDSDSDSEDHDPAPKRARKGKERESGPSSISSSGTQATGGIAAPVASDKGVHSFLEELPLKLVHRTSIFKDLGITTRAHFDALAHVPKPLQEELFKELRKRNVVLVETLVLRSALNAIRDAVAQPNPRAGRAQAQPTDVAAFLAAMHPPMSHRLPVLRKLGVDANHLPVLAGLDEESYKVFEGELGAAGVTWVERLLLRASLRPSL